MALRCESYISGVLQLGMMDASGQQVQWFNFRRGECVQL